MKISCVGISHQTAPVDVRERFAISPAKVPATLRSALAQPGVREAVLISTCNRVELYLAGDADPMDVLFGLRRGEAAARREWFYCMEHGTAVGHLFRVASGLDSMVLGETEILGQIKQAYATAVESASVGPALNRLFQRAFRTAKQVRSSTGITRGSVSVGSVAVDLAERIFGKLSNCHAMILGAGATSERTARALLSRGARSMIVSNRSADRAAALASELGGEAISFEDWPNRLCGVDIIISSTSAPHTIVEAETLQRHMKSRVDRPLFLIDLAVPRDVDPIVDRVEGVYLYDIDSLQGIAAETLALRASEVGACEAIIAPQAEQFVGWLDSAAKQTWQARRRLQALDNRRYLQA